MKAWARAFVVVVAGMATCPACGLLSPGQDSAQYVVLASVDELPGDAAADLATTSSSVRVGLGPVTLPEYVRRAEIVSRIDGTGLVLSSTDRWAEPLDRAVLRVLAIDLERTLGTGRLVQHPWYESDRPDVQIEIDFSRCERDESGGFVLAARWSVRRLEGGASAIQRESRIEREITGPDGASLALAFSHALADLCREIALTWTERDEAGGEPR